MPSLSTGYNIANQALEAFQTALDVTANNISNVNTPGYSRETVNLGESDPSTFFGGQPYQLGSGVTIESVTGIQNFLLNASMNSAQSGLGQYQTLANQLQSVQNLFPDVSGTSGISTDLTNFFNAFSALSASPGSDSAQLGVQQAAETLTSDVQSTYSGLQQQGQQVTSQISQTIQQINQLTSQIASLNQQIGAQTAEGNSPNSLIDSQQQDLQQLAGLINIQTSTNSNGSVSVYSDGYNLVDSAGSNPMPETYTPGSTTFSNGSTSLTVQSGQLAGLAQALTKVNSYQTQLDTLANTLTSQVNSIYSSGTNSAGQTGQQFFVESNPSGGAAGFAVTAAIQANAGAIASGTSGSKGDGGMAEQISNLNTSSISALGSQSFESYYTGLLGQVGADVQNANNSSSTANSLVQQVQSQQQSVSGVNIDEELSNMLLYQHGYESAAKALSVIDTTTEDLIQMLQ